MADHDEHDIPDIDNREQDTDGVNSRAVSEETIAYEPTSTTTTLNDGQSRRVLQADRLDRSDVHTTMLQPYVYCARMHVETDTGMTEHPPSDGLFEPELMENQQPQAVDVIRGAVSFASYPPAVKTPLTVHDYCRVFDTVVTTGGVLKGRNEHNLVGAVVLYPGRCLNQTAPIETDLKTPLPPLPKCNVDTAGAMAIVGWFSPLDEKNPLSQLVIKPTSYAYAAVRVVAIKIGDLIEHLQQQIAHLNAQLTALEAKRASSPTPGLVALDIQAASAAKQNMVARVAAIEARNYKFTGMSADVSDTKIKPSAHLSRRVLLYVYDVVDELRQRALELLRPNIDGFEAARDAHARRLWAAPNRNGEAIGLRVECLGSTDGKFPRFATMIVLPNIPISPVLAALSETARGCDVAALDKTTSVGTSATDVVVVEDRYTSLLKRTATANGGAKLNNAPPTVVITAPTKKAMTSTSAETLDTILAALTKNAGAVTTKRLGEQYVKAKRKSNADGDAEPSTKRAKGAAAKSADSETVAAPKSADAVEPAVATKPVESQPAPIATPAIAPPTPVAKPTAAPPASDSKQSSTSDDGRLVLPGDTKPMMNTTLLTTHARLAARFDGTTKYLAKTAPGFGPVGRVTVDTDRLNSAQREQLASAAQFLQMFGLLEQVNALIQQEGTRIEQVEIARVAEEKRKAEEEARRAAEEKKRKEEEEAARLAAEKKRQEEEAARRAAAAAASSDDEKKRKEERERIAAEKKKRAEELKRQLEQAEAEAREALEF